MNSGPRLAFGAQGSDVRRVQTIFVMMKTLGFEQIDGVFGTATKTAVIDFQQSEGLSADGVVGTATWARMPADPDTPVLRRGATGSAVIGLQKGLLKFGGTGSPTDPGPPDGSFGPRTEAAVKAYQMQLGLDHDGVVGPRSWWAPAGAAGATLASLSELMTALERRASNRTLRALTESRSGFRADVREPPLHRVRSVADAQGPTISGRSTRPWFRPPCHCRQ